MNHNNSAFDGQEQDRSTRTPEPHSFLRRLANGRIWGYGLFWSWNIIFLVFMFLGFAPFVLPDTIQSVRDGIIPFNFLAYAIILTLIPILAVILGITVLRHSPAKLLALGYGVEGPLMVMLIIRFFVIRDANTAILMLLIVGSLAMLALLWQILDTRLDQRPLVFGYLRVVGLTLTLLVGIYAGIAVTFFAIPLAAALPQLGKGMLEGLGDTLRNFEWRDFFSLTFGILGALLALYTATLVVAMPIVVPGIYVWQWWRGLKSVATRHSWLRPALIALCVMTLVTTLFIWSNQQPQHTAYALLKTTLTSPEQANALHQKEDQLRSGLLNAYLAPLRYIGAVGEYGLIQGLYQSSLNLSDKNATQVEQIYEVWVRPLLYEPMSHETPVNTPAQSGPQRALEQEPQKAARLYEAYFDIPIFEGERETILRAVRATWSAEQALSGWQAVDDREVLLTQQEVNIKEHGDWAEVELYEVYLNQTFNRQEVVYYFSLPESAVITGIWLGNSPDREQRFAYQVAPRGAAQAIYRNEISYNIDPALIEQIGPFQYRLRIFPVEPKLWSGSTEASTIIKNGPSLHFWMTYSVLAENNAWPMPYMADKINVYWDEHTNYTVNGQMATNTGQDTGQEWLPSSIAASESVVPASHRVDFPSGESVIINPISSDDTPILPDRLNLAVVLDRSASMAAHASALEESLGVLAAYPANVDVYLTSSIYRGEAPSRTKLASLSDQNITFMGGQNAADLLDQFYDLYDGSAYDAIFVLTDGSGFKLGESISPLVNDVSAPPPDMPVWMVHLDGNFPLGYDDATLQILQASQGGVAGSIEAALDRLAFSLQLDKPIAADSSVDQVDGYEWVTVPNGDQSSSGPSTILHSTDDPFATIAARRLILDTLHRQRGQINQISTLDNLHAIAVSQSIVTPYSSMIVLVNDRQQRTLEQLEGQTDRFQREAEALGETTAANPFQVTGVPEPHEWLLLGLAALMLGWYALRRR